MTESPTRHSSARVPLILGLLGVTALAIPLVAHVVRAQGAHTEPAEEDHDCPGEGCEICAHEAELVTLTDEQIALAGIEVAEVGGGMVGEAIEVPGLIHPNADHLASVSAPSLATVVKVHANLGDRIEEGAVLLTMRSATLAEAEAKAREFEGRITLARETLARTKELADLGEFSLPDFEEAEKEARTAEQALAAAQARYDRTVRLAGLDAIGGPAYDAAKAVYATAVHARERADEELAAAEARAGVGAFDRPGSETAEEGVADAASTLSAAEHELNLARAELARVEETVASGAVGDSPAEEAARAYKQAGAEVRATRGALTAAQRERERVAALRADDLTSERELEQATAAHEKAVAEFEAAEAELETADARRQRAERLRGARVDANRALEEAQTRVADAESAVESARERNRIARDRSAREGTLSAQSVASREALAKAREAARSALAEEEAAQREWERQQAIASENLPNNAALSEAAADLGSARAADEAARSRYDREKAIFDRRLRAKQQLAEAEGEVRREEIGLQSARSATRILSAGGSQGSGQFEVRAPIPGWVTARTAKPGLVAAEAEVLLEIADISSVWAEAILDDRDLGRVEVGDPVTIIVPAYPDRVFLSKVASIDVVMDEETRRARARATITNDDLSLRPEMLATMTIELDSKQAQVVVPDEAVLYDEETPYVWVEVEPNGFQRRDVEIGVRGAERLEVVAGLEPGETVVVREAVLVKGEAVRAELEEDGCVD